ncbi:iron-sulfur cluster repair di-iron protein [Shewanella fodinae]|uniref:Regulator of cell morphogenesis and NO signaling n=1 Tax=Shewanella fodinae TaxID=552357 RepID=A0A4R2FJZ8_9GAMM|nr:iron-sulfur cluster repair di-iron protein [Shewanella fodinae]TCN90719.1 regulator of cell morphogenesis and NO signaling [Shewanella fodinae]
MSKEIELDRRVGDLVAEDFRNAHVFSQFGIDFCCGGGRTLTAACQRANADPTIVIQALQQLQRSGDKQDQLRQLPLADLIDHIEHKHHEYVRQKAPLLLEYADKMVRAHGDKYEEIKPVAGWIKALVADLLPHLQKEEQVLFPAIRALSNGDRINSCFGTIDNPIHAMEYEHEEAGQILQKLRQLTQDYQPPAHACTTWRVCYATLAEFEQDLFTHIHLENNVLFPKALQLEV